MFPSCLCACNDGTHTGACHRCRKCDDTDVVRQEGNDPQQNATGIAHVQRNGPCVTLANSLLAETTEKTASCLCHMSSDCRSVTIDTLFVRVLT